MQEDLIILCLKECPSKKKRGMKFIRLYRDIEKYKNKFLTGVYEPLQPMYETEIPYVFWSALYEILSSVDEQA